MTGDINTQIQLWRQKARSGEMTLEDFKQAFNHIRQDRVHASATSAASKGKKSAASAKKNINSDDLLSELDGL